MARLDQSGKTLILLLGDQLTPHIASLRAVPKHQAIILMAEVMDEASYVHHHRKKLILFFSAMRHFAGELRAVGWTVDYVKLDDPGNTQSLAGEMERARQRHACTRVLMTEPGEWRLKQVFAETEQLEDDRFICGHGAFRAWAEGRKELRMEFFYREMRRRTGLLMNGTEPEGGRWNFDAENRKPAKASLFMPQPLHFAPDSITTEVISLVEKRFPQGFGAAQPFWFATDREGASQALSHFLSQALPHFGETQDAMLSGQPFLHHSLLSAYINLGLLDPLDVCRRVEAEYRKGRVPLPSAEGFIRQIIGWREYVRGIYWLHMPGYRDSNALSAHRPLPQFYWTGETTMNCLAQVVGQTRSEAYAHHIQRLMVTGNFALLAGLDPREVHEWYLAVYVDAIEWVELPNTIGMALHADGGIMASKPYAASGAYINRMSDYCASCRYDVKKRTGEGACPFNALYWNFIASHQQRFSRNPRMAQMVKTWNAFDPADREAIRQSAEAFLSRLKPATY